MNKALEILKKHTGHAHGLMHASTVDAMQEYATECIKVSLEEAKESANQSYFCDHAIDQITDESNIILL